MALACRLGESLALGLDFGFASVADFWPPMGLDFVLEAAAKDFTLCGPVPEVTATVLFVVAPCGFDFGELLEPPLTEAFSLAEPGFAPPAAPAASPPLRM